MLFCSFFFLMRRRPPRSTRTYTRCPYTPLCRSLRRAVAAGIAPGKIVFSGVGKTADEMRLALDLGIFQFNLESEPEAEMLSEVALAMGKVAPVRSEEHTSELQSLMRISYAVFCLQKKKYTTISRLRYTIYE